ncbi:TIR-NBS-LRR RCT1-like resistance protein, putative [Medicago truncatula]|uniref:TIR-NBS-LRR RCT1-like resistance protein, putative n=2 Tax=Medicago truncatula TaxID=3880 RepID=A0A072U5Q2_MEDTR|nr:TIR-NBS-LRR RCT1-like resistance protein, putative [Medicago truncatula]
MKPKCAIPDHNKTVDGFGGFLLRDDSYPDRLIFNCKASDGLKTVMVKNYTKGTIQLYKRDALVAFQEEEGHRLVSSIEPGNKVEFVFVFKNRFIVKETTMYIIYDELIGETMEQSHAQTDKSVNVSSDGENECTLLD